jgi:hypothetical protein
MSLVKIRVLSSASLEVSLAVKGGIFTSDKQVKMPGP